MPHIISIKDLKILRRFPKCAVRQMNLFMLLKTDMVIW